MVATGSDVEHDIARTIAHELGHYLGLFHRQQMPNASDDSQHQPVDYNLMNVHLLGHIAENKMTSDQRTSFDLGQVMIANNLDDATGLPFP